MEKQGIKVGLLAVVLFLIFTASAFAQAGQANVRIAAEGDTVWVVVNHVKADKRAQFERFVYEIFWPAAQKLDKKTQRAFDNTRVLNAVGPEDDGTYTYVFLMDPVITGEDYLIENLLGKMYPKDKANEYLKLFEESLAREGKHYIVVQSRHWQGAKGK